MQLWNPCFRARHQSAAVDVCTFLDGQVSGGELRTLFAAMDLDENGSVSLGEFQQFVSYQ